MKTINVVDMELGSNIRITADNLPQLEGTEKQITYAQDIRERVLRGNATEIQGMINSGKVSMERLMEMTSKQFGIPINSVNEMANAIFEGRPQVKDLRKEKSAAKIIDKYQNWYR